jgi:hypothetical protein
LSINTVDLTQLRIAASANGAECNSPAQRAGSLREQATER